MHDLHIAHMTQYFYDEFAKYDARHLEDNVCRLSFKVLYRIYICLSRRISGYVEIRMILDNANLSIWSQRNKERC